VVFGGSAWLKEETGAGRRSKCVRCQTLFLNMFLLLFFFEKKSIPDSLRNWLPRIAFIVHRIRATVVGRWFGQEAAQLCMRSIITRGTPSSSGRACPFSRLISAHTAGSVRRYQYVCGPGPGTVDRMLDQSQLFQLAKQNRFKADLLLCYNKI
jgi:hypothetical protein